MLKQQSIINFIGRHTEINIFKQWFSDTNPDAPKILYFHDALEAKEKKGGAGKTWLLRHCAQIVEEQYPGSVVVRIDFFDIASRDGVVIVERIVEALKEAFPTWVTANFDEALKSYQETAGPEYQENTEQRAALTRALAADLKVLETIFTQSKTFLLVMFDTTEIIEDTPSVAVLNTTQLFPDNYQFKRMKFVIASRNKIDWSQPNWQGREREVRQIAVHPFNQQEMIEFLLREAIYDPDTRQEQAQALYARTEGRPIMVGLVADVLNNRVATVEDLIAVQPSSFDSYLVPQIQQLENPVNWVILFMAHVYHRFNGDILHWILSQADLKDIVHDLSHQELMNRLPSLSFVRTFATGDYLVLHDEMRKLVNTYCWGRQDPDHTLRKDISKSMIKYFEQQLQRKQGESIPSDQENQTLTVELLFHMLFLDIKKGLKFFEQRFSSALNLSQRAFARTLLQETQIFWNTMDKQQQQDLQMRHAELLRVEENPAAAFIIYEQIEKNANQDWLTVHEAKMLWDKSQCYILQSKFSDAIDYMLLSLAIEKAHGNEQQVGTLLNKLGFAYRSQGQFDMAQQYYQQGLDLYAKLENQSEYANIINNLSNIHRLLGKTQLALRTCQIGLNIRKSLFQAGEGSEYSVALSLSTMGLINLDGGHFVWGGQWFQNAYEIHLRLGRKRELAQLYNRFGQIAMAQRDYTKAENWLRRAEEASFEINAEAYTNSLNKQGRLHMIQKRMSESVPLFERAIKRAREVRDDYQQAENLVDLAQALYRLKSDEAAEKALQEAHDISERWRYYDLFGRAEQFLGDISYELRDYKTAFLHYRQYCRYMAIRSDVEYNHALRLIIDKLYEVPKENALMIIDDFTAYWVQENMNIEYPELATTLADISKAKSFERQPSTQSLPFLDI